MLAGWLGMIGLLCVLHFGGFHALALWWRARGVAVEPIMQRPMLARNLGEFWSRRWNRAFADLAARFVLRPIARRWSPAAGLFASFVASGVIHDLVISVPARGGYGLPTIYFTINGLTVLMLRGKHARRLRLNTGWRGRTIAMAVLALPLPLVVHEPFVMNVIVPFIDAVTTFDMKGALP
jgi:alginate O-acetyltransferase complex protein AlgI